MMNYILLSSAPQLELIRSLIRREKHPDLVSCPEPEATLFSEANYRERQRDPQSTLNATTMTMSHETCSVALVPTATEEGPREQQAQRRVGGGSEPRPGTRNQVDGEAG